MGLLDGKVAIITGSGGGIGRAHALLFAQEGAQVVVNDLGGARDGTGKGVSAAEKVVAEIKAAGGQAAPSYDDVSERAGAENMVQIALKQFGQVDILINNAGILRDKTLLKMDEAMWDVVIRVHLRGTFLCTQAAARAMVERQKGGRIVNTTSVSGLIGNFGQANYSSAKAGIYGLTRTAHLELFQKHKITVNALAPIAHTRLTEDLPVMQAMPNAKEMLAPEHVAPVALFLASDLAADLSGVVVGVQGTQVNLYHMEVTPGIAPRGAAWTPAELRERWAEIEGKKS
ncbi:MAG TPA: SDR family NAD(P)-dependent oxidoreductase [Polyangia bacterium]|nr:SDR family NAD(P)-dependent oxidoreductase [Polyangia bacterium]